MSENGRKKRKNIRGSIEDKKKKKKSEKKGGVLATGVGIRGCQHGESSGENSPSHQLLMLDSQQPYM